MTGGNKQDAVERDALRLFEQLADHADDPKARRRILKFASPATRVVLDELEAADLRATSRFATAFPESGSDAVARPIRIGPYRLTERIGAGGMGEVWRAERDDGLFDQVVAIKLIRPGIMSALASDRFAEERRLLARLDHMGIARIMDGGLTPDAWPYLVMEHVKGVPIDVWADEHGASVAARVGLVAQAATAAQAAHTQLIAHADIKPDNLLVTQDGQVKLIDFGIAELLGHEQASTIRPITRHFASPERIEGAPPSVADDVHALGMVLAAIVPPGERDRDLTAIIDKARAAYAADRYASADRLGADLARWQALRPVAARPVGPGHVFRLFLRRNRRPVAVAAGLVLTACAAAGLAIANHHAAEIAQAAEAQRVNELLRVNHYVLFDLDSRLARMPHSLALRAALAARSQTYLDRLGALPDASPAVRIEAANGLARLASIQDRPSEPSLGQPRAAIASLDRGAALVANLSGPEAATAYCTILLDTARIRIFALADLNGADRALQRTASCLPRVGKGPLQGYALLLRAQLSSWRSHFTDEIRLARLALAAPPPADPRDAALRRISMLSALGDGLFWPYPAATPLPVYRQEYAIARDAAARWPHDPAVLQALGRSAWDLGSDLLEIKRPQEALAVLDQGVDAISRVTRFDTQDEQAARMRIIIENNRAQTLSALGRTREAMALYDAGVERWATMYREAPDPVRLRDYAIGLNTDGTVHAKAGDVAQACRLYERALLLLQGQDARHQLSPFDQKQTIGLIRENQGKYCPAANPRPDRDGAAARPAPPATGA